MLRAGTILVVLWVWGQPAGAEPESLVLEPVARVVPEARREVSGIARSRKEDGLYWIHGDSGSPARVYPVRADGTLAWGTAGVEIRGAQNTDWEDLALDASGRLIIADMGNNAQARTDLRLYVLPEPAAGATSAPAAEEWHVRYPDQTRLDGKPAGPANFDCEAVFTVGDEVFLLTKHRSDTRTKLYRVDRGRDRELGRRDTLPPWSMLTYIDSFDAGGMVTAADASRDGARLAVLTYGRVWVFERGDTHTPFFAGRLLSRRIEASLSGGLLESACFDADGSLVLVAENGRVYRLHARDLWEVRPARSIPERPAEQDLVAMSFNIRYAGADDGPNAWGMRRGLVQAEIEREAPDVLGLQEVEAVQADWLRGALPGYGFHGVGRMDGRSKGEFAPIMFRTDRFDLLDSGHFWLSESPGTPGSKGWDAACERMASWVRLRDKAAGGTLLVLNTHLDHVGVRARAEGLALIRDRLRTLRREGDAVVVTGDFNTSADGEQAPALVGGEGSARLVDTFREVFPARDEDEGTFNNWSFTLKGERIDWVLASPDLCPVSAAIDRRVPGGRHPSDHYPVTARLRRR
ncbi:MAG: endonuclease/exonuclease/phosphatase family protein [Leptolyngbya sp. PLA1]|nr:endonuclease/exonuclease/phosphatase family protein [Leptolyngbya sp. PLA1]